ncbi:MAG: aminotransferase class III-fold pyridoxal phosphate-dependent enzyme, partial [Vicinamibacterales bacterium]
MSAMATSTTVPHLKTALPGPKAKAIIERDARAVSPSYTRDYPFVIAKGAGAVVEDVDGNVFLDCTAGIAVTAAGHSHPDVVQAIVDQAQKFLHMSGTDFYYEPQVRLAEELSAIAPMPGPHRSFFGNSGTEANEAALKLAKYYTKRHGVIAFFGAFHGRSMGSLSVTASKVTQRKGFAPMVPGTYHAPYADCYRCPVNATPDSCAAECLSFIEQQLFVHLVSPDEVAAVIVEPIQGEGGYIVPPHVFLQRLREITSRYGILLIADEVQSGMGRTGRMFAIEHAGVEPDIVSIGKGIASGLPLGVITAPATIMSWPPGSHASTFGGNPVSCAAALTTIRLLREGLMRNAEVVGAYLRDGLTALMNKHAIIGDVRGRG